MAKKNTKKIDYHKIEVNNRYFRRNRLPNKTPFFMTAHMQGDGRGCSSGPVYWELPNCSTKSEAEKLAEELFREADRNLSYIGGWFDEGFSVKKNSKFKSSK